MKIRNAMLSIVAIGILLVVAGCNDAPRNLNTYAELNGDGKPEVIFGDFGTMRQHYVDYNLMARFSSGTGWSEPQLIWRFQGRPDHIDFTDIDNDGDLDLVFSVYGKMRQHYVEYDTYVLWNDGSGSFGSPELINRQRK